MRMFNCYRWKLRGWKRNDLLPLCYTSLSAFSLRFHMPVPESMRVVTNITTESHCTGSIEFGRHMPLAKATPTLCCVSVVVMPTESVLAWQHYAYSFWKNWFPSLETLLLFRRIFLWGEVNTPYVSWCFSSWPLLLAWNVKITSNAGNQKSIRMHI